MDIEKELAEHQVILLLMPNAEYTEEVLKDIRRLSKKTVCFVTLNKTFPGIRDMLKEKKINTENIVFIDAISKSIRSVPSQADGCYYVSSPSSLTELEIAVLKLLRHGFQYLVFDSLTSMLVYQKNAPVARFVSALANNVRKNNAKAVFYAVKSEDQKQMIAEVGPFVDKVVDLGK